MYQIVYNKLFQVVYRRGGCFKVEKYKESAHYTIIPGASMLLARLFPQSAVTLVLKVRKTDKMGSFLNYLKEVHLETN